LHVKDRGRKAEREESEDYAEAGDCENERLGWADRKEGG
jgi:hypothetical protein